MIDDSIADVLKIIESKATHHAGDIIYREGIGNCVIKGFVYSQGQEWCILATNENVSFRILIKDIEVINDESV